MANGFGTLTKPNGYKYSGGWEDNDYHGHAKICFADGSEFEGFFKNGYRHGKGKHKSPSGKLHYEIWRDGDLEEIIGENSEFEHSRPQTCMDMDESTKDLVS